MKVPLRQALDALSGRFSELMEHGSDGETLDALEALCLAPDDEALDRAAGFVEALRNLGCVHPVADVGDDDDDPDDHAARYWLLVGMMAGGRVMEGEPRLPA